MPSANQEKACMHALLAWKQSSSRYVTVLLTSSDTSISYLPGRDLVLLVLCINSRMWLRTVAQRDGCGIQLPCLSGSWSHRGPQFRTRLKGSSDWMQITSKSNCRLSAGDIEFPVKEDWFSGPAEQGARQGAERQLRLLMLWWDGGLWCEPSGREAGWAVEIQGEGLPFPFLLESPMGSITGSQGCPKFNSKAHSFPLIFLISPRCTRWYNSSSAVLLNLSFAFSWIFDMN